MAQHKINIKIKGNIKHLLKHTTEFFKHLNLNYYVLPARHIWHTEGCTKLNKFSDSISHPPF